MATVLKRKRRLKLCSKLHEAIEGLFYGLVPFRLRSFRLLAITSPKSDSVVSPTWIDRA